MLQLPVIVKAGYQDDAGCRHDLVELRGKLDPGHPRHADVTHEQADPPGVLPCQLQRTQGAGRIEHGVTGLRQEARHESPRAGIVVDDENGVAACLNRVPPIR